MSCLPKKLWQRCQSFACRRFASTRAQHGKVSNIQQDEFPLFYAASPNTRSIGRYVRRKLKAMVDKARVTGIAYINAAGNHKSLAIIGKSKSPACFKSLKAAKPLPYLFSTKAWMTQAVFGQWMTEVFVPAVTKRHGTRHVILILDNAPGHATVETWEGGAKATVHILFLPANLTSAHQPCDQGIIAALKKRYKTQMLLELERNVESVEMFRARRQQAKDEGRRACEAGLAYGFRAHVLDAMSLLKQAWDAITTETIVHCWRKAHCLHEIFAETEICRR